MADRPPTRRTRTLADLVDGCLDKAMAAQGFAGADVILSWEDIVGERLARYSQPIKMDWPRRFQPTGERTADAASLVIRVESAFAIEMQHLAPLVVERVNAHYGWRCVGRLVLKQGPVRRAPAPKPERPPLPPAEHERIAVATAAVADVELRAALNRFGRSVIGDAARERASCRS